MRILVLDNYDSFTYNLVQILMRLGMGPSMDVIRNDRISIEEAGRYDRILLSPGPGIPSEAGNMSGIIEKYKQDRSILGICLGHQGIAEAFGARLYNMDTVLHGIRSEVEVLDEDEILFQGLPPRFTIGHYHSWAVDENSLPEDIVVTCKDPRGIVMGIRHLQYNIRGLQFHPESIMTDHGTDMIENWLKN